jgi:NAD(P)-dependent dehydrogenase (short-subunit alcohol dehydrogenase family)
MNVNAKSIYLMSKFAIPAMKTGGGGSIINTGSGWGLVGGPKAAVYCASKGAVVQLTKAMAIDHGPDRIRVNCVCPGDTDTSMLHDEARQLCRDEDDFMKEAAARPLGRVGTPEDVARAVLFFAGDQSVYVTGSTLVVDGGGLAGG